MAFGSAEVFRADVVFRANTAEFAGDAAKIRQEAERTYGVLDQRALRAAIASEKYDRALARSRGSSFAVMKATQAYRAELARLDSEQGHAGGRARSTASEFDREERSIGRLAKGAIAGSGALGRMRSAAVFASTSFLGGYGLTYALKAVVDEASRVQEETEKTGIVFGKNAADVQRWANTLAQSFGIGEGAALKAAGTFGNMLRPLGFGEQAAAQMSKRLVELSADMASFNNVKPDQVLAALSSGLAGQVRPLRQYGVFLSQTRIQEEAVADGIAKHSQKLTQAQKVQAAYNIILKDTKLQQGDVARNSESLSVAESKLTAGVQDLEAGLARGLLPQLVAVVNHGASWLNQSRNQERVQRDVAAAAHTVEGAAKGVVDVYRLLAPPVRIANRLLGGTEHAVRALAIAFVALKLRGVAAELGLLRTRTVEAGAAAVKTAAEYDAMAASEGRAAAAGRGIGAGGLFGAALAASVAAPYVVAGGRDLGQFLHNNVYSGFGDTNLPKGVSFADAAGAIERLKSGKVLSDRDRQVLTKLGVPLPNAPAGVGNATDTRELNPRANVPGSPGYAPSGPGAASTPPKPLSRSEQAALNVSQAQLAVARGEKGAEQRLIAALKAQIDLDRSNEQLQERLARTDVKNRKQHLQTLQGLYSDEQSALDQITQIEQAHEKAKTKTAAKRQKASEEAVKQARLRRIAGGGEVALLQHQEALARGSAEGSKELARILQLEQAALEQQLKALEAIHASQVKIDDVRRKLTALKKREAALTADEAAAAKKTAAAAAKTADFAAVEREFLSGFESVIAQYAPNVRGPGIGTFEQHIHFPNAPTNDGHQEAVYARRAALAAFDG